MLPYETAGVRFITNKKIILVDGQSYLHQLGGVSALFSASEIAVSPVSCHLDG